MGSIFKPKVTQSPVFGRGWLRRCDDAYRFALSLV